MFLRKLIPATVAALVASAQFACAGPLPDADQSEADWRYDLLLYAFLPTRTTGTSTVAGQSVDLDLDLGDVLDLLNWAASGRFEAWRGDYGLIVDTNYYDLGLQGTLPGPLATQFDIQVRQKWLGLLGAYRVANGTYGDADRRFTVDVQAGARYNNLKQTVTLTNPLPLPVLGGDEGWWEPVVGARGIWDLNERWNAVVSADFGGFGAGGNDLQVGANAGVEFKPWDRTSLVFGYRYFSMDYSTTTSTGKFGYDVKQHGPVLGLKLNF